MIMHSAIYDYAFDYICIRLYMTLPSAHALVRLATATKRRTRKIVEVCQVDLDPGRAFKTALRDLKETFGSPSVAGRCPMTGIVGRAYHKAHSRRPARPMHQFELSQFSPVCGSSGGFSSFLLCF